MNLSEWLAAVDGREIGNGQCWDLAQDYTTRVVGGGTLNTQIGSHPGYAGDVWEGYGSNGVEKWFTQAPASATAGAGWLAVWAWGMPYTPFTHIAVTLQDVGLMVDCETQNPGAAHREKLPKVGLLGYLVPRGNGVQNALDFNDVKPYAPWDPNPAPKTSLPDWWDAFMKSLKPILDFAVFVDKAGKWLSDPGNWRRIGVFALGALLVVIALAKMFGSDAMKVVNDVAS